MNAAVFNPLSYSKKLETAGFTKQQAEIQSSAIFEIIERLAAKKDLAGLENIKSATTLTAAFLNSI